VMINHGITTGALFIAVGIIYERLHTRETGRRRGARQIHGRFHLLSSACSASPRSLSPAPTVSSAKFLVLSGGFAVSLLLVACAVPGVVASAAYNFRMLQRIAFGGINNPDHHDIKDLNFREIVTLAPLLVFVFWIGLHSPAVRQRHARERAEPHRQAGAFSK